MHVFATLVSQPGKADTIRDAVTELATATRTEPGNLHYMVHEDPKHPGSFFFFEVYKDQAATNTHMKSSHLAAAFAKIGGLIASPPVITETKLIAGE